MLLVRTRTPTFSSLMKGHTMQVQPYLFFEGRCEEALEFYGRALGAKTNGLMRYKDAPPEHAMPPDCPAPNPEKVMHASFTIGETTLFASDGLAAGQPTFKGFSLSLNAANEAEADRVFGQLAEGGQVQMPLGKTFFSPRFGMVTDRFGMGWMVIVMPAE
jgi:PhnB protein